MAPLTVVKYQAYDRIVQQYTEHLNSIKSFEMSAIVSMTILNPFLKDMILKETIGKVMSSYQKDSV
jgi:hypothetical protein